MCSLHGLAIWWGLGGLAGLNNGWPSWRDDHPLYYHTALVTRSFLKTSWTTAGYDPSFMAGYAKSVVFPSSSTLPEMVVTFCRGQRPEFAYKVYVLISAAVVPWLVALACFLWRVPAAGTAIAVLLDLLYIWTDFPINYVTWGMLPYFVAIPVGLAATGAFAWFLSNGGTVQWLVATVLSSLAFLCHLTAAMVIAPRGGPRVREHMLRRRARRIGRRSSVREQLRASRPRSGWSADGNVAPGGLDDPARRTRGQCVLVAAWDLAGFDERARAASLFSTPRA